MDRITEILQELKARHGVEFGSDDETNETRIEREKRECQANCDRYNKIKGNQDEIDGHNCDICNNKGDYLKVQQNADSSFDSVFCKCECWKIRRPIRAMLRSGLKDVIKEYTFDKYIVTEPWQQGVLDIAQKYLQETEKHWFFFGGATGAGKSHICTALAIQLLKRNNEVKYMIWSDEAKKLKAKVNDEDYADMIEQYKTVDVLYIDDLFKTGKDGMQIKQRPTTGDINLAFEIINSRYFQKKITIISSECTIDDLIDIDDAIGGRVKQKCGDYCISIAPDRSKNYRLR